MSDIDREWAISELSKFITAIKIIRDPSPGIFAVINVKKLIQLLGKSIYANKWKIRKNMPSSLSFVIPGN